MFVHYRTVTIQAYSMEMRCLYVSCKKNSRAYHSKLAKSLWRTTHSKVLAMMTCKFGEDDDNDANENIVKCFYLHFIERNFYMAISFYKCLTVYLCFLKINSIYMFIYILDEQMIKFYSLYISDVC